MAPDPVDALFACLADRRRRRLVEYVAERPGPVDVDDAARHLAAAKDGAADDEAPEEGEDTVAIALIHTHLPKLDDAGVVAVDRETGTVETGDRFDAAASLLEEV